MRVISKSLQIYKKNRTFASFVRFFFVIVSFLLIFSLVRFAHNRIRVPRSISGMKRVCLRFVQQHRQRIHIKSCTKQLHICFLARPQFGEHQSGIISQVYLLAFGSTENDCRLSAPVTQQPPRLSLRGAGLLLRLLHSSYGIARSICFPPARCLRSTRVYHSRPPRMSVRSVSLWRAENYAITHAVSPTHAGSNIARAGVCNATPCHDEKKEQAVIVGLLPLALFANQVCLLSDRTLFNHLFAHLREEPPPDERPPPELPPDERPPPLLNPPDERPPPL